MVLRNSGDVMIQALSVCIEEAGASDVVTWKVMPQRGLHMIVVVWCGICSMFRLTERL